MSFLELTMACIIALSSSSLASTAFFEVFEGFWIGHIEKNIVWTCICPAVMFRSGSSSSLSERTIVFLVVIFLRFLWFSFSCVKRIVYSRSRWLINPASICRLTAIFLWRNYCEETFLVEFCLEGCSFKTWNVVFFSCTIALVFFDAFDFLHVKLPLPFLWYSLHFTFVLFKYK